MRKVVGWFFTKASSRSLGVLSGNRSSSSWAVMKATSVDSRGRTFSGGKTVRRKAWVSKRASTMEETVIFKKSRFRCSRVMIFSQSHWST